MFFKIGVLKNFENFTGKHLCCWSLFLIIAGLTFFYGTPLVGASDFTLFWFIDFQAARINIYHVIIEFISNDSSFGRESNP